MTPHAICHYCDAPLEPDADPAGRCKQCADGERIAALLVDVAARVRGRRSGAWHRRPFDERFADVVATGAVLDALLAPVRALVDERETTRALEQTLDGWTRVLAAADQAAADALARLAARLEMPATAGAAAIVARAIAALDAATAAVLERNQWEVRS
jgi:hypothetical protein